MKELANRLRGNVGNPEFSVLNDTTVDFPEDEGELHEGGIREMLEMGERLARHFGSLLADAQPEEKVYFSSVRERAWMSAVYLQDGLSNGMGTNMTQEIIERNDICRFYDYCPYYDESVLHNNTAMREVTLYRNGPELESLPDIIAQRLQLNDQVTISASEWTNTIPFKTLP